MIGHKLYGKGLEKVLVMHDWFSDCSSYDAMLPFLDVNRFTYAFMDLRGYGRSRAIQGNCSVEEAAQDALALADHLRWNQFYVVGHSMSGMIAQRIALDAQPRVKGVVAITPVPACGSPIPEDVMTFLEGAAHSNNQSACQIIGFMTGNKLPDRFCEYKVQQWRATSIPEARVAYLRMFAETNFADQVKGIETPFLVIIGGHDAEGHSESVMKETFLKWYPKAKLAIIQNSGHYPMQETPLYLLGLIENFLGA